MQLAILRPLLVSSFNFLLVYKNLFFMLIGWTDAYHVFYLYAYIFADNSSMFLLNVNSHSVLQYPSPNEWFETLSLCDNRNEW